MAAQQSWTSWLTNGWLGNEPPADVEPSLNNNNVKITSPETTQAAGTSASETPYGPYVRTGRGGAGNFTWQSEQPLPKTGSDLEAQNPSTLSERRRAAELAEHHDIGAAIKSQTAQRPTSQYIRVGRGYVQSNEMQTSPQSETLSSRSPISPVVSNPPVAHPGRGGAGNRAAAAELNERVLRERQEKEQQEAEQRREKIEKEVQNALPMPPDAWLGGRRRSMDNAGGVV